MVLILIKLNGWMKKAMAQTFGYQTVAAPTNECAYWNKTRHSP